MKAQLVVKKFGHLLKESFTGFMADNGLKLSASLSYYTIFALPPLLIIIMFLCGIFFGNVAVNGELFSQINTLVGDTAALQIQQIIKNIKLSDSNTFVAVIGVIILIIGASGVFAEIQDSINIIWGIKAKPKHGLIKFVINRLMTFSMIASVGFLLLVGLIINSLLVLLNKNLAAYFPKDIIYLFYVINTIIVFIIITILFTLIFKSLPDGKVALRDCIIGASFTAFLFMIGKFAIGAYIRSTAIASIYGAAGSLILILAWIYYSAIILYFGTEFTKVYAHTHGDKIIPNDNTIIILNPNSEVEEKKI